MANKQKKATVPKKERAKEYEKKVKLNTSFENAINILLKPVQPANIETKK